MALSLWRGRILVAGVLTSAVAHACAASTLTISCASSYQDVVRTIARIYEGEHPDRTIRVNVGGSHLLARQIEEGAPVDLFLSADHPTIARLVSLGRIDSASVTRVAGNEVVVIAPSDRALEITDPSALAATWIRRISLPDTTVPIGRYARSYLRAAGLLDSMQGRIVRTENVRAGLAAAASGAVDLAFVYATDARTTDRVRVVWKIPAGTIPPVLSYAGIVRRPEVADWTADFLRFLVAPEGQAVFEAAGFLPVEDAAD